jgi:hypothetical protein
MGMPSAWKTPVPPVVGCAAEFAAFFFLIAAVLAAHAADGFFGDGATYLTINTAEYAAHPLFPFFDRQDTGHPLIFAWINGLLWRWLGFSTTIANVSMWFYAAWALTLFRRLGQRIGVRLLGIAAPRWIGLAAALGLFSTPLFIGNTALYLSEMPNLAFSLSMLAAWDRNRRGWMGFWASVTALTRITGCLAVLGLGLFDLWLRRDRLKRAGSAARQLAPWVAGACVLSVYLGIKLLVLGRPLTTIPVNSSFVLHPADLARQFGVIFLQVLNEPKWGPGLWLLPIAAVGVFRIGVRIGGRAPDLPSAAPDEQRKAWTLLWGYAAMLVGPTVAYALHDDWPQPRYCVIHQGLILLVGVPALAALLARRQAVAVVLIAGWCLLQIGRWQPTWVETALQRMGLPGLAPYVAMYPPLTLETAEYKRLNRRLGDWYAAEAPPKTLFLTGYQTAYVLNEPLAGYVRESSPCYDLKWLLAEPERLEDYLALARGEGREIYMVHASWHDERERQATLKVVSGRPEFVQAAAFLGRRGNEIRVYRYRPELRGAHPAGIPDRGRDGMRVWTWFYDALLGRPIDMSAYTSMEWVMGRVGDRRAEAVKWLHELVHSREYTLRTLTTHERIAAVYNAMLERAPTAGEAARWNAALAADPAAIDLLIDTLTAEPAFDAMLEKRLPPIP